MASDTTSPRCVLVPGGAGAIGANLVRELLALGASVVVLDDLSSGRQNDLPEHEHLAFIEGCVLDESAVAEAFSHRPEVVLNLAACFANQNSIEHPRRDLRVNAEGAVHLMESAVRCGGIERFVQISSSCVYGSQDGLLSETCPAAPGTPYAISKLTSERYATFYSRHHGLPTVSLRYFNSFGPFDYPGRYRSVIPNWVARAFRGQPLPITGTGDETRDFTHVSDIVAGTLLAMVEPAAIGKVLNLGSGTETAVRELARQVNDLTRNPAGVEFAERRDWDHTSRRWAGIERARDVLGFEPRVSVREGLRQYVEWYASTLTDSHHSATGDGSGGERS